MTREPPDDNEGRGAVDPADISPLSSQVLGHFGGPLATVDSAEAILSEEIVIVTRRRLRAVRQLGRTPKFLVGATLFGIVTLLAVFAPIAGRYDPNLPNYDALNTGPSAAHIFGTDFLGRDLWSRIVWGGRISLVVGVLVVLLSLVVGVPWGLIAGYGGRLIDDLLMRLIDVLLAFPGLVLAFSIIAILGTGSESVIIALGVSGIPGYARIARASTLTIKSLDYVQSSRALGAGPWQIMRRHVLRNIIDPLVIIATLNLSGAILAAAALSFLGVGTQPPQADWGTMLANGYQYMFVSYAQVLFPAIVIIITVLGINLMGDAIGEALNPRLSGR